MISWSSDEDGLQIRPLQVSDVPFVTSNWLHTYRDSPSTWGIRNTEYFHYQHKKIEEVVARGTTLILCNSARPDQDLGFLTYEVFPGRILVLHYCYFKRAYRGMGLARILVDEVISAEVPDSVQVTHRTKTSGQILHKVKDCKDWRMNPYILDITLPPGWAD